MKSLFGRQHESSIIMIKVRIILAFKKLKTKNTLESVHEIYGMWFVP